MTMTFKTTTETELVGVDIAEGSDEPPIIEFKVGSVFGLAFPFEMPLDEARGMAHHILSITEGR